MLAEQRGRIGEVSVEVPPPPPSQGTAEAIFVQTPSLCLQVHPLDAIVVLGPLERRGDLAQPTVGQVIVAIC